MEGLHKMWPLQHLRMDVIGSEVNPAERQGVAKHEASSRSDVVEKGPPGGRVLISDVGFTEKI